MHFCCSSCFRVVHTSHSKLYWSSLFPSPEPSHPLDFHGPRPSFLTSRLPTTGHRRVGNNTAHIPLNLVNSSLVFLRLVSSREPASDTKTSGLFLRPYFLHSPITTTLQAHCTVVVPQPSCLSSRPWLTGSSRSDSPHPPVRYLCRLNCYTGNLSNKNPLFLTFPQLDHAVWPEFARFNHLRLLADCV